MEREIQLTLSKDSVGLSMADTYMGDVTRDGSQLRLLAQHSVAMLETFETIGSHLKQLRNRGNKERQKSK